MSIGEAVCAMVRATLCCCGLSGNSGMLQSPVSSNRSSVSGNWLATSSCGLRCQEYGAFALASGLERPKCGEAGCCTGVVMGVLAAVDSRGEWERGGGEVSWESSFTVVLVVVVVVVGGGGGGLALI
jgi:hypothetical protein